MAANEEDGRVPRVAVGGCSVDDNLYIYATAISAALISTPSGKTPVST